MNIFKTAHAYPPPNSNRQSEPVVEAPALAVKTFHIVVAVFFVLFVWAHTATLAHALRLSVLIMLIKAVLEIHFYVRESTLPFVNSSAYAWFIALCGTVAPLLFRPSTGELPDVTLATGLQAIGLAVQVYVICTMNRGTDAARRGMSRDGLYRFVRHPIHLAFVFSGYGYVLNHTTAYNLGILVLVTVLQYLRVREEERLLDDDDEYQDYAEHTRWLVIPKVF